jgi:hypothetical protein
MRGFWMLVHFLGLALWLGGGIATMVGGITAKPFPAAERLAAYRISSAVQRILVGPGAIAVVLSGIFLSMPYMRSGAMPGWIGMMTGTGVLGALLAITLSVPTAARLGRLQLDARGELPEAFTALRKRQVLAASIAGGLALVALGAATIGRF